MNSFQILPSLPCETDLSTLQRQRVLVVADVDNLDISLRTSHQRRLAYGHLRHRLLFAAAAVKTCALFSAAKGDEKKASELRCQGWRVRTIPREVVHTVNGPQVKGNADTDIACEVAWLIARSPHCDAVVIASGDGDLCVAIARSLRALSGGRLKIYTLSVPGAASHRLTTRCDLFDGAIAIGRDVTPIINRKSVANPTSIARKIAA
jgi:hypothetical protein